ncbi:MAG TPA: hypothetical protein VIU14_09315 [Mesorhizobium sp.]|jgi:hypothetical protein
MGSRLLSLAVMACATAGAWVVASAGTGSTAVDSVVTGSIGTSQQEFRLSSRAGGDWCTVSKGTKTKAGVAEVKFDPACNMLMPGLDLVRFWRDRSDGSVEFVGSGGETLAAFGPADGEGYESFRPRTPLLSLSSGG